MGLSRAREVSASTGRELPPNRTASSSVAPLVCTIGMVPATLVASVAAYSLLASQEENAADARMGLALHEGPSSLCEYMQRPLTSSLCCKGPFEKSSLCEVTHQKNVLSRIEALCEAYSEWRCWRSLAESFYAWWTFLAHELLLDRMVFSRRRDSRWACARSTSEAARITRMPRRLY